MPAGRLDTATISRLPRRTTPGLLDTATTGQWSNNTGTHTAQYGIDMIVVVVGWGITQSEF